MSIIAKPSINATIFKRLSASSIAIRKDTKIDVNGAVVTFSSDTTVTLPSLTVGADYVVFVSSSGAAEAVAWTGNTAQWSTSGGEWEKGAIAYPSAPMTNAIPVGGFHYAPGGNGGNSQAGGDTTPSINKHSFWDLRFRPNCDDPRGMVYTGLCWFDIYFLGVDHETNGTSRYDVNIANGTVKPIRASLFGGNGSALQEFNWWAAAEALAVHGKRLPTYQEFCCATFGTTEQAERGNVPITTGIATTNAGTTNTDEKFTSWCGVIQSTGVHWIWGADTNFWDDTTDGTGQHFITEGRGSIYAQGSRAMTVLLFGGKYNLSGNSGSRCTETIEALSDTTLSISARGVANHLQF
jgi:hypothetical protein